MKTNRGGYIAPENVIGRDELIQEIWETLEQQSVVLTAARRMGKTSIIKKMEHEAPGHIFAIYHDLEGVRSPFEFVETIYADVEAQLQNKTRFAKRASDFMKQIAGTEVKGLKLPSVLAAHWKTLLIKTIEDLEEQQDRTIIFFGMNSQ